MSATPVNKNHAVPPPSAATSAAAPGAADKGAMASYEKVRKELREMIGRKRVLDKNLVWTPLAPSLLNHNQQ